MEIILNLLILLTLEYLLDSAITRLGRIHRKERKQTPAAPASSTMPILERPRQMRTMLRALQ